MSSVPVEQMIERAGRTLAGAASAPAKVILFGSHARGDATEGSDLDFLVIEREVEDRTAEALRLRRALGLGTPVDVIVMDEAPVRRRAKVKGTMVDRALREGRVVARVLSTSSTPKSCCAGLTTTSTPVACWPRPPMSATAP